MCRPRVGTETQGLAVPVDHLEPLARMRLGAPPPFVEELGTEVGGQRVPFERGLPENVQGLLPSGGSGGVRACGVEGLSGDPSGVQRRDHRGRKGEGGGQVLDLGKDELVEKLDRRVFGGGLDPVSSVHVLLANEAAVHPHYERGKPHLGGDVGDLALVGALGPTNGRGGKQEGG